MKTTARRSYIALLLVAVVIGGLILLGVRLFVHGEEWATMRASSHITSDGSFIGAGSVTDRKGVILATTSDGERVYNDSEDVRRATLHIVGDTEGYISSGVQTAYKTELIGYNRVTGLYSLKKYGRGNDVALTLDADLCACALDALGGRKGLIAAYNYKTGELLCSVSSPNYDVRSKPTAKEIAADPDGAYDGLYLNRLIDGLYTPGSIFKIVTTVCAVENMPKLDDWEFTCEGEITIGGVDVTCPHSHGSLTFREALADSCNCAFATLAAKLGADKLQATAAELGFGKTFAFGNGTTQASRFDLTNAAPGDVAWAGVGQYTTLVNPYHMLTVLGAIANDGTAVEPYVVSSVTSPSGRTVMKPQPSTDAYLPPEIARKVGDYLRSDVTDNYGDWNFEGLSMCGKTGTAEVGDDKEPHAWFVGYSQNERCPVAIVVCIENGGWGATSAIPVASDVMEEIYKSVS